MSNAQAKAIELVIFKPKADVTTKETKTALESLTPILKTYNGFISREIGMDENNKWMDLVFWETMEDAKSAAEAVMEDETVIRAFEVIDKQEMAFYHFKSASELPDNG